MDEEKDLFNEVIKEKLTNYSLPIDDDSWEKIEERLHPPLRGRIQRRWIAAIAVAASIALLFLLFPTDRKTRQPETANQISNHEKPIVQDAPERSIDQLALSQAVEHPVGFRKSQPVEQSAENNLTSEVVSTEEITEKDAPVTEKKESVTKNHQGFINPFPDSEKGTAVPAIKRKKRQSIRLSFGSGENLLAYNNAMKTSQNVDFISGESGYSNAMYFKASYQNTGALNAKEILSNESYPNVTYHPPLSFGLTVKKELNRTFSIESGVVYSFLATTLRRDLPKSTADLQLHYIGIPLNLHTRLFADRSSQWEVYVSAGGMVEKGLLSHFVQKNYYGDSYSSVESIISNEKINGLQWSVNFSPGVDYKIYKNYSIYLEPKLSYYFDNDQPVSARTEHPVIIGINAGIRYSW